MPDDLHRSAALTRELARWVAGLRFEHLPAATLRHQRLLLLDSLGAGFHGRDLPWTEAVATWAERQRPAAGPRLSSRWGASEPTLRPSDAALVNGVAVHGFELDDFHNAKVHPGAVVTPAVLALAEARGLDGARVLAALAAGYEVTIRLSLALGPAPARQRGWHLTGICGALGAAAAAANLLGFDEERTAWALGLGGTQSAGLFAFTADGSMSKRLHAGRSAQSAVLAAELVELGVTGPSQILEAADGGWLKAFCQEAESGPLLSELGSRWHAAEMNFKPYACCGSLHPHIDAALALRQEWDRRSPVRVGLPRLVDLQCGYPYARGSVLNAQMSARYCVAVALLDGAALPEQFSEARIDGREVTDLAQRIELVVDPALDPLYPASFCGWVEIAGGRRISLENPSGHPSNPQWAESLQRKFLSLAGTPGNGAARRLIEAVESLESLPASALTALLAEANCNRSDGKAPQSGIA